MAGKEFCPGRFSPTDPTRIHRFVQTNESNVVRGVDPLGDKSVVEYGDLRPVPRVLKAAVTRLQ